ncbi:zinc finger, C4 type, partial [Ancylostoma caninum]
PPCAVCGDPSTGIHFGADSCAACSAFFRRTVAVNRAFECTGDNLNDCMSVKGSSSCKKCRFERCLTAGMDMNNSDGILDDLIVNFKSLNYRRQLLYCTDFPIEEIFSMKELVSALIVLVFCWFSRVITLANARFVQPFSGPAHLNVFGASALMW